MILNFIGILIVILIVLGIIIYYKNQLDKAPEEEEVDSIYSLNYLITAVAKAFAPGAKEIITGVAL